MKPIRLINPYISFDDVEYELRGIFESGVFTRGQYVEALRRDLATYTGAKHAFLLTSATTALWTCLKLLGVCPGDEVIVSDFSFPASANVIEDLGATPVFADVDPHSYNMLCSEIEKKHTTKTKAVIFVDALGNPSGVNEIKSLCTKYGIPLIEDAACAIGSSEYGRRCGAIADLTCFSFHPRKLINTGEGGAITTNRDDWAEWLSVKLSHGADGFKGLALDFVDYGYNFRLSELQAALGCKQLKKITEIIQERNETRLEYIKQLTPLGFVAQSIGTHVVFNAQSVAFRVPSDCNRDKLIVALRQLGIETTIGTYSLSSTTFYASKYAMPQQNSSRLEKTTITLPCFKGIDVHEVVRSISRVTAEVRDG